MILVDERGKIVLVNAQLEKLFGYNRAELLGQSIEMMVPQRFRSRHPGYRANFFSDPNARLMGAGRSLYGLRKDGTEISVEIGLSPLETPEGSFVLSSVLDVTERKLAEMERQKFVSLADQSTEFIGMCDLEFKPFYVNPNGLRLVGLETVDEALRTRVNDFFFPEDQKFILEDFFPRVLREGRSEVEIRFRHFKSGDALWVIYNVFQVNGTDGRPVGYATVSKDITERKRVEGEREELLKKFQTLTSELETRVSDRTAQLSNSLREREVLLQEIHHRVKNNLQVISSLMNMQLRRIKHQPSREALQECQTRVQAIALIHGMLYQSRDYSSIPFSEYARSLAANVFNAAGVTPDAISMELAIEDVRLGVDKAIPCGLILTELISNALKHAFPNGRHGVVRVELRRIEPGKLLLAVTDNGIGLPPDIDVKTSHSLGLHLVCSLAEQLGAEFEMAREKDTSFQLTFTAGEEAAPFPLRP
jgi:PAS domain S-box-containing protein